MPPLQTPSLSELGAKSRLNFTLQSCQRHDFLSQSQAPKLKGEKAKAGSDLLRERWASGCRHCLLGCESPHLPLPPSPPQRAVKVSLNILENVKYTARCQLPKTIKLTLWTSRDFLEPVRGICLTSRRFLRSNFKIKPLSI